MVKIMKEKIQKFLKQDICIITLLFILSRILLLIFILRKQLTNTTIYDAIHYISIAKNGYTKEALYAFFPLYPLSIRLVHHIIPSYKVTAMLLSNLFSLLSAFVLYKMIDNKKKKILAITLLLFSPILAYTTIGYTESLYLLLTITSFYFYKKKNYLISGLFIGLSIITRNTGLVLLGAIGLDMLFNIYKKKNTIKELIQLSIIPIIITISYHAYLYINTKDIFKYVTVQFTEWNRTHCNLITMIIKDIKFVIKYNNSIYIFIQDLLFYIIALIYSIKYIKKERAQSIYMIVSLILFTTTCRTTNWLTLPSIGLFRYVFSLFPMYTLPIKEKNKNIITIILALYILFAITNFIMIYQYGSFLA